MAPADLGDGIRGRRRRRRPPPLRARVRATPGIVRVGPPDRARGPPRSAPGPTGPASRSGASGWAMPASTSRRASRPVSVRHRSVGQQGAQYRRAVGAQRDEPTRLSADQDRAAGEDAHRPVEDQPEPRGHGGHRERPPSTGMTAPVSGSLSFPASHTRVSATSSGVSRRPMGCCSAKDRVSASP